MRGKLACAVRRGADGEGPLKKRDLAGGLPYCTDDFFDQCPHRMACAKCAFYCPKGSSQAQLLEGKANLQRMLQEIPLTEDERAAVEDGIAAMEKLCQQLADVPTPAGLTPNQLVQTDLVEKQPDRVRELRQLLAKRYRDVNGKPPN